jgi:hypothetical protein
MVVGLATDVFVGLGNNGRWFFQPDLVELGIKDVLDTLVGVNADRQSTAAGSLQTILAVAAAETQEAQTGTVGLRSTASEAVLRMFAGGQKRLHDLGCVRADGLSPAREPFR